MRDRSFDIMQFERRVEQLIINDPPRKAYFASSEDTVLAKLEWFRQGGEISERQWKDVLGMIKTQSGRLDMPYLESWAIELGVNDLLQRALKETMERGI